MGERAREREREIEKEIEIESYPKKESVLLSRHCVRVAKEMDSKSIGLCPQGFEFPRCRWQVEAEGATEGGMKRRERERERERESEREKERERLTQ